MSIEVKFLKIILFFGVNKKRHWKTYKHVENTSVESFKISIESIFKINHHNINANKTKKNPSSISPKILPESPENAHGLVFGHALAIKSYRL